MIVACLGDSITEGAPGWDRRHGGDETSQWQHWAARSLPGVVFRNCGVSGERTDELAVRLDDSGVGADVLVLQGGINDIAQGRQVARAAESLHELARRGKDLGLRVLVADVLPWNDGWPAADVSIRRLNALIGELAAAEDVHVLAFHDALEDRHRRGRMRDEWTADGSHPSVEGYRVLGEVVAGVLRSLNSGS